MFNRTFLTSVPFVKNITLLKIQWQSISVWNIERISKDYPCPHLRCKESELQGGERKYNWLWEKKYLGPVLSFLAGQELEVEELIRTQVSQGANSALCMLCGKVMSTKNSIRVHMRDQHSKFKCKYFCPICEKIYANKNSMSCHLSTMHREQLKGIPIEKFVMKDWHGDRHK